MVLEKPLSVPSLKLENEKNSLLIRQKMIDAAEGRFVTVTEELNRGSEILGKYPLTVSVFGSARLAQEHPVCRQAFAASWALAKHGYAIVTGGGGGVMQAANHGAKKAEGVSIGFNIQLPMEQTLNEHTTESYTFEHFFSRKVALTLDACGYVYCGGGFGTLDELFEIITLEQTGIIPKVPIILLGVDFWTPLDRFIRTTLAEEFETIDLDDTDLYTITDDIALVVEKIEAHSLEKARLAMEERAERFKHRWKRADDMELIKQ